MTAKKVEVICSRESELATMASEISTVKEKVDEMHRHIIGNGRPGLLERVSNNETTFKVIYGILTIFLAFIGTIAVFVFGG